MAARATLEPEVIRRAVPVALVLEASQREGLRTESEALPAQEHQQVISQTAEQTAALPPED
jgi:hypothetical protein